MSSPSQELLLLELESQSVWHTDALAFKNYCRLQRFCFACRR